MVSEHNTASFKTPHKFCIGLLLYILKIAPPPTSFATQFVTVCATSTSSATHSCCNQNWNNEAWCWRQEVWFPV